ncbi:MAG: DoxX family protein [Bacteroidetes bacterium]|nr:DoxX family protein [Bacteroidota bacterium]
MKYIELVGRFLYSIIFLRTIMNHFTADAIGYAVFTGVPVPSVLVPLSGGLAIIGAISIILGYKTKWGALLIVAFLIPVTLFMHAFWKETDPTEMQRQMTSFMKNTSMLGGALIISYFGAGPLSVDAKKKK